MKKFLLNPHRSSAENVTLIALILKQTNKQQAGHGAVVQIAIGYFLPRCLSDLN